jgi:hypothetical protein
MPMANEDERLGQPIRVAREPVGPKNAGTKGSIGDQAVMDAIAIVLLSWLIIFLLAFTLRRHSI